MGKVYAIGVGPGHPDQLTDVAKKILRKCDIIIGYRYTLNTIQNFLEGKEIHEITMKTQEEIYQQVSENLGEKILVVPFTGDVNFSESEVVDRLIEIFGEVEVIPGISAIQVASSKSKIPLDKSKIITMHVTSSIEEKKIELQKALIDGLSVILVPRPWPNQPKRHFMPSEIAKYLKNNGFDTCQLKVQVFEFLTTEKEKIFSGFVSDLENREFSDMSVIVIKQGKLESYKNLK